VDFESTTNTTTTGSIVEINPTKAVLYFFSCTSSESGLEDWMCLDLNSFTPGSALYLLILELSLYSLKNVPPTLPMSITLKKMQAWKTKADHILELRDLYDGIHIHILSVTKESMQSDASQRANHKVCTLERLCLLVSLVYRLKMKARHKQRQIQLQIEAFHAVIAINDPTKVQDPFV
jgi:hypothetical protein